MRVLIFHRHLVVLHRSQIDVEALLTQNLQTNNVTFDVQNLGNTKRTISTVLQSRGGPLSKAACQRSLRKPSPLLVVRGHSRRRGRPDRNRWSRIVRTLRERSRQGANPSASAGSAHGRGSGPRPRAARRSCPTEAAPATHGGREPARRRRRGPSTADGQLHGSGGAGRRLAGVRITHQVVRTQAPCPRFFGCQRPRSSGTVPSCSRVRAPS
mmetsp:Transcript_1677/g.3958  ORF Transcript_1677/g.3958 Transcript_1677/m.3958 type:complete len:212 (+) Transcript_1677:480-1115(+)